ncbi:MAG: methylated-DNA--[protein]-cysteine S-methyltransferase [Deltaproteobacteria bacterium]|jgi:O-6-methylguanine DNA methyltransferase|nr:methylated-DNA--[protein]-cysteine S-methyltransferase [Deltaproteobacteria bacterium]
MKTKHLYQSPIGLLEMTVEDQTLTCLDFVIGGPNFTPPPLDSLVSTVINELNEYFLGQRQNFTFSFKATGSSFQEVVWQDLVTIAYGETITYNQIATRIGRPKATRAVGRAVNQNPLSIVIPCHRVIGTSGHLTGYRGGLDKKAYLLDLEKYYKAQ